MSHHALVVDDNKQNLRVLSQMLSKQGVHSTEVFDPLTLEAILPTLEAVDVIFLDLEMPGLDGFAVKDRILKTFVNIPIIAYTVHISEMNVIQEHGFSGMLAKPLDGARFPDQLARILRGEQVWERV